MFNDNITKDSRTSVIMDEKISVPRMFDDASFGNSLAILLYPRLKQQEKVHCYFNYYYSKEDICFNEDTLTIWICNLRGDSSREECFKSTIDTFSNLENIKEIPKVRKFFNDEAACFVDVVQKASAIIIKNTFDIQMYHFIQSGIPAFMPWYFKEIPLSQKEMELLSSMTERSGNKYKSCYQELENELNIKEKFVHSKLDGFEDCSLITSMDRLINTKVSLERDINDLQERIGEKLKHINELRLNIAALATAINDGNNNEIASFFIKNKNLILISSYGNNIVFKVVAFLEYFDEEMAATYINNSRSFFFKVNGNSYQTKLSDDDIKILVTSIFVDRTLKIKLCAQYKLDASSSVRGLSGMSLEEYELKNCMPNTHINRYECLGDYNRIITELMKNGDNITAVQQCVESTKSLNLGDSVVMREFMTELLGDKCRKCILLPNGEYTNAQGAVKYLRGEQ